MSFVSFSFPVLFLKLGSVCVGCNTGRLVIPGTNEGGDNVYIYIIFMYSYVCRGGRSAACPKGQSV